MMILLSLSIFKLYLEKIAMHSSSHSWPREIRDPVRRSSNTYACCAAGDSVDDSGTVTCFWGQIVPPLATVTVGPVAGLILLQCGSASGWR